LVLEQLFKAKQRLLLHKTINNGGKQPREGFEETLLANGSHVSNPLILKTNQAKRQ
jgi:hypothetical protein